MLLLLQFPYRANADVFEPGIIYTFRLTITEHGTSIYTDVYLEANAPPSSGTFEVTPTFGEALSTIHVLSANNWVDDVDDYPLMYQFQYALDSTYLETFLLRTPMQNSYTTALFSAGLASNNFTVYLSALVIDINDASVVAFTEVQSTEVIAADSTVRNLLAGISDSLNAFDIDSVLQSVSGVSLYLDSTNCSNYDSNNCGALYNRESCSSVAHTCGNCQDGFVGVFGDSNSMCHNSTAVQLTFPGSPCNESSTCAFGECDFMSQLCVAHSKVCPSSIPDTTCSGHGICEHRGTNEGEMCTVINNFCSVMCLCEEGYSGSSCYHDAITSQSIEADRSSLCSALYSSAILQDSSSTTLQSLIGPFVKSFSPFEIENLETFTNCSNAFGEIMLLVEGGYLDNLSVEYRTGVATALSNFAISLNISGLNEMVAASLDTLVTSLLDSMLQGEEAIDLVTDAFQTSVTYILSVELADATLLPPSTLDGAFYGQQVLPSITLPSTGLDACGTQSYTKMSVTTYSELGNPFTSSNNTFAGRTLSNLLEFKVDTPLNGSISSGDGVVDDNSTMVPTFTLVQVFDTYQNWSASYQPGLVRAVLDPDVGDVSGTHLMYELTSCEVLQYTSYNVTYLCEDVAALLCSSQLSSGRRLRQLQAETGTTLGSNVDSSFYTDVAVVVGDGSASVLQVPLGNLADSTIGISFVSSLVVTIILGFLYFARWDHIEKMQHKYLRNAEERHVRVKKLHKSKESMISRAFARMNSYMFASSKTLSTGLSGLVTATDQCAKYSELERSLLPFLNRVMGPLDLFAVRDWWTKYIRIVRTEHLWIRPFSYASSKLTRKIRFLGLANEIMIIAFVDTLFFLLFAPMSETCHLDNETDCLATTSPITDDGLLCKWTEDEAMANGGICDVNPPPETMLFFVVVSFIVTVVAVPFKILSYLLLEEICALSPDFGDIRTYFSKSTFRMSELGKVMRQENGNDIANSETNVDETILFPESYLSRIAKYYDVATTEEELTYILETARTYLARFLANMPVPWESYQAADISVSDVKSNFHLNDESVIHTITQLRINEMLRQLNLNDDGSPAQLTWFQFLRYGTHSNYLQSKLRSAKAKAERIDEQFGAVCAGEDDLKDIMLLQHFILEALSPIQRYVVRKKFFDFEMQEPESINKWVWMCGWSLEIVTMAFMCYYVLAWAAIVGNAIFISWLIQFSFILLEDFFITQMIRAILVHGLAISYCKPQLLQIYHLLKKIASCKILKQDVVHDDIRVVQHFSGTCRAARRELIRELPAAQLLMQIDDNDMKQCHDIRRTKLIWWQVALISIPLFFGFAGDQVQEFAFDMVINVTWGMLLILHALLLQVINFWIIIGVYLALMGCCLYRAYVFYRKRTSKQKAKRTSRGELARFMSMKNFRPKFNVISIIKSKRSITALAISKNDLQWRNMNLRLQQPITEMDTIIKLATRDVSIPESIQSLSTLAPLLVSHCPPLSKEVNEESRPPSWNRHSSIRSKLRSKRVADFWESRKESAKNCQRQSPLYFECREYFLRLSEGMDHVYKDEAIESLAEWLHQLKETDVIDNTTTGLNLYDEVEEIVTALEFLMIYHEQKLPLTVFLDWVVEEELLLDSSFTNILTNSTVLSKADIHNELDYTKGQKVSRFRMMVSTKRVRKHRKSGDMDLFGQIVKEVAAAKQAENALIKYMEYTAKQEDKDKDKDARTLVNRVTDTVSDKYQQQQAASDHRRIQSKKKMSTSFQSYFTTRRIRSRSSSSASTIPSTTHSNTSRRTLFRRSTDTFYKANKSKRPHKSNASALGSDEDQNKKSTETAAHHRGHTTTPTHTVAPGPTLDSILAGTRKGSTRPPPVKVFSIKSAKAFAL